MAIKQIEMDSRDSASYRKHLRNVGFLSASYLSTSGFDVSSLKKLAASVRRSWRICAAWHESCGTPLAGGMTSLRDVS